MIFHRLLPDNFKRDADGLLGMCSSASRESVIILLGGPSAYYTLDLVEDTYLPMMSVNCGHMTKTGMVAPQYWTGYDNPVRFDQDVFRDPRVLKFCPSNRAGELLRDEKTTLAECPSVFFFDAQKRASNGELFTLGPVIDTRDSMLQAIDIAIKLGYRDILLHGADLFTPLSDEQVDYINQQLQMVGADIPFSLACSVNSSMEALTCIAHAKVCKGTSPSDMTDTQKQACESVVDELISMLSRMDTPDMYSVGSANTKLKDNLRSDFHYRVTSGRLIGARRNLDALGVSVSLLRGPQDFRSRLDGFFPVVRIDAVKDDGVVTDPDYQARGLYRRADAGIA